MSFPDTPAVDPAARPWPEQWAIQVAVEADRIEGRLRIAVAADRPDADRRASREAVERHLAAARAACLRPPRRWWRGLRDRWRGTSVEQAYRNAHSAKVFLVDLLPPNELQMLAPEVGSRLASVLDRADPRRVEAERLLTGDTDGRVRRAALKQAMETSYDAADEKYTRLRDFRNIILLTAALITVFLGLLTLAVARTPDAVPLCFERPATASTASSVPGSACPSGLRQSPSPGDMPIVAGLGAIGGLLAGLISIRTLRGSSVPYSIPVALALLKVPAGMLTAVAGILLFGGGFVPGLSNLDSQRQILAYALVFGYAQQLITRLVDDRAQSILNKIPSKSPEAPAVEPNPPVPAPATDPPSAPAAPAARRAPATPINQRVTGPPRPTEQTPPGGFRSSDAGAAVGQPPPDQPTPPADFRPPEQGPTATDRATTD
ncbi:hypothetical protein ACFOX0_28065 [Micromonospora zhanjiangensis]|uniref:Uncharacterized protein n=1 Tax=Micromonospora zhanjiangensis TaxID=1522057 RepID=A0ABV8KUT6_9ACTN